MRAIAYLPPAERGRAVREYEGRLCRITYRGSKAYGGDFSRSVEGVVIGAAHPLTQGNSTGDLVVRARPGFRFGEGDGLAAVTIGLANVGTIEVLP